MFQKIKKKQQFYSTILLRSKANLYTKSSYKSCRDMHIMQLAINHYVRLFMRIEYDPQPKHEDTQLLWAGISENAKLTKGHEPGKPFAFFLKNENGKIEGGVSGFIFYGCLYIDLLWVDQSLRGKKYGTQLVDSVIELAKQNKCNFVAVNTMDFEALDFYLKLGFYLEFERRGFDKGSIFYFLRKDLI